MGTCFHLVDVRHRTYFALDKWCPDVFSNMSGQHPRCDPTYDSLVDAIAAEGRSWMPAEVRLRELHEFLASADWTVILRGDCWDQPQPDYFEVYRSFRMVGCMYGLTPFGPCPQCGDGAFLDIDGLCHRCAWNWSEEA